MRHRDKINIAYFRDIWKFIWQWWRLIGQNWPVWYFIFCSVFILAWIHFSWSPSFDILLNFTIATWLKLAQSAPENVNTSSFKFVWVCVCSLLFLMNLLSSFTSGNICIVLCKKVKFQYHQKFLTFRDGIGESYYERGGVIHRKSLVDNVVCGHTKRVPAITWS